MHHGYDKRCRQQPAPTDPDVATPLALPAMSYLLDAAEATPEDLAMLREEFGPDSTPLGWDAVYAFESEHGIVLPEPYRSFVATIGDSSYSGPPDYGLMELGTLPRTGAPVDQSGIWPSLSRSPDSGSGRAAMGRSRMTTSSPRSTTTAHLCWAPMAAACTGT